MSVFDHLFAFFGFPPKPSGRRDTIPGEFHGSTWGMDEGDDDDFKSEPRQDFGWPRQQFGFSIDSDPLEMHRFFEQQFDEVLKRFHSFGFGNMFGGLVFQNQLPGSEEPREKGLWEQYLKPGYDKGDLSHDTRKDSDLDGKVSTNAIDQFFKSTSPISRPQTKSSGVVNPDNYLAKPDNFFFNSDRSLTMSKQPNASIQSFGQSVTKRIVRRPDGSEEHQYTVKDSKGNEETTVTRQIGEQSYSVTTKTKANGEQEFIKNFINLDENNLEDFEKKWGRKL